MTKFVPDKNAEFFLIISRPVKTIPENKLEEDTMAEKLKSPEAEPTAK